MLDRTERVYSDGTWCIWSMHPGTLQMITNKAPSNTREREQ